MCWPTDCMWTSGAVVVCRACSCRVCMESAHRWLHNARSKKLLLQTNVKVAQIVSRCLESTDDDGEGEREKVARFACCGV